jgi:hypothetical protein
MTKHYALLRMSPSRLDIAGMPLNRREAGIDPQAALT